jgi:heme/copper-type cytochrome/quinol oxidase subunit 3
MSITDTTSQSEPHSEMHGGVPGHHEDPETVDARQRLGIWLFIGADVIVVAALLFTYLYLRGTDTSGHWMSMSGYKGSLHTYEKFSDMADAGTLKDPTTIYTGVLSVGLQWLAAALTVVSAGVVWLAERGLRKTKNTKAFAAVVVVATLVALGGVLVSAIQLHEIPQVFVAVNDSYTMSYTAYDSAMLAIIASALFHLVVVAFLGLGLTIRATRGVINGDKWYQARLVRLYWVWVAISAVVVTLITTTITTVH